jgi:hypothetical protein
MSLGRVTKTAAAALAVATLSVVRFWVVAAEANDIMDLRTVPIRRQGRRHAHSRLA